MKLSIEAVEEFQSLYKKRFSVDLTHEEAVDQATHLLRLMKTVLQARARQRRGKRDQQAARCDKPRA